MPFPGTFVRAPVMAAKHGMPDLSLTGVDDHGTSPINAVAAAVGGSGGAGKLLSTGMQAVAPVFASLPTLGRV